MSKLKTKRKKHYLAAAMLAMLAVATPITLYGSVTTYAQTDDAAGAESGEDTGEVTNEETGYHYQKTGEPLVEEKDNNGNIWRIYAAAENTADTEATADTADAVDTEDTSVKKYIATITYGGVDTNSSRAGEFSVFSGYADVFAKYNIVQVEVGEGLTYFNVYSPPENLQYEYIYLPSTMQKLTTALVQQQKKLKEITIPASVTEFNSGSFNHGMFYMDESLEKITFEEGCKLTSFGKNVQYLLYGCKSLKEFTVPASIETIPERCFYNSQYLETIRFEKGSKVESIGKEAFYACYALKDVELAEGLTTIGESAFRNLDQMEKLVIPGTVTTIGICAFYDCDGLQEIVIPDSVTSIGKAAFAYCGNVTDIQLSDQLEMIEEQAFMGCSKVSSLRIPDSVKTIKDEAFRYIYITELPYMQNVTTIGTRAFSISNLRSLEYPKCLTDFTATSLDGGGNAKIKYITFEDGCALNTLPEGLFSTYKENNTNLKEQREIKLPLSLKELNMNVFCGSWNRTMVEIPHKDNDSLQLTLTDYGDKSKETIANSLKSMYYMVHSFEIYRCLTETFGVPRDHITFHEEKVGWKLTGVKDGIYTYTAECSTCGEVSKSLTYDENGFATVDGSYQPAEQVTAENCKAFGLDENYIGYYAVSNAGQLYWFADYVNGNGDDATAHLSENVVLCNDIEMNDTSEWDVWTDETTNVINWPSLGSYNVNFTKYNIIYQGVFDGNHKTIRGLYRKNPGYDNQGGLIGYIGRLGALKNLTIEKSYVTACAVFAGFNNGSVTNCTAGRLRTKYCGHGGAVFVYKNYGIMDACVNTADVEWIDKQRENCFGIVDMNYGIVKNCVNRGAINNTGGRISGDVGGICDWNNGKILNCYNEAPITSTGQAAGIVRDNKGYVANCYNKGALTGTYVGGIAAGTGVAEGGDVIIVNPSIGGWEDTSGGSSDDSGSGSAEAEELVPVSLSQYGIYYCYNTGAVTASDSCAGGIAAYAICSKGTIYGCYNTGDVEGGSHTGGIVGGVENALIRDCYNYSTNIKTTNVATSFQNNEPHAFAAPIAGCVSSYLGNAVVSACCYVGDIDVEAYGYSMDLKGHKVTFTDNEAMTVKDFESGKAAWKLQNGINEDLKASGGKQLFVWKQIISGAEIERYPYLDLTEEETSRSVMQMTFHYTTGGKDLAGYGYTNYNHAVTETQAPTVTGKNDTIHTFDWYEDKELTTLYDFTHVLTTDKDVYAEAYDLYTLEFKLTEGSYASASVDKKKVKELITETGETVVFTVTPDTGCILEGVSLEGKTLTPDEDGNYTISDISANHTVEITTKETEVTFTYKAGEHGTVKWVGDETGSGELTETIKAVSGTPKGVLPVADLGWHFVKWVDSKEGSPSYSITGLYPTAVNGVFEGETYTAIFEKNIETYAISGTVRDPEGNPVPGVTVKLKGNDDTKKTTSAEDGSYRFEKLEEAEYQLAAIKYYENNWKAESETVGVRLEESDVTGRDLKLSMNRATNTKPDGIIEYYRVTLTENARDYLEETGGDVVEDSDYTLSARDRYSNAHAVVYVYEAVRGFDGNYYKLSDEVAEALKTDGRCYTIKNIGKDYIIDVKAEDVIPNRYEVTIPSGGDDYTILPEKEGETISYGEDYSFTVKAAAGRCVLVSANGTRIEFADGKYTIKNVTKPQKIVVEFADQHTCGEWKVVTPATYDAAGEETRTCSVCGAVEIRELAQLICDHEAKRLITDKEATCTMAGSGHYVCDTCGKTVQENVSIAAKGHIWTAWTVTVKPTTSKAGEESRTCSVCKQTEKHQVSKLSQKKYKITYKLNKGKNNKKNPKTYTSAKKVVLKKPTRKGYAFKGWYTDRKCTKKITSIKKGSKKNYTIYAKWSKVKVKKTTGLKVMNTKGKNLVVRYSKVSGAKGYQITYATNSKFTKGKKVVNTTKRTKTIQKLKKGKTYYVRVRAYKKDSTGRKVYGKYSTVKKIKITK